MNQEKMLRMTSREHYLNVVVLVLVELNMMCIHSRGFVPSSLLLKCTVLTRTLKLSCFLQFWAYRWYS